MGIAMYYSKTARGFYHPEIHGENMPVDAVQISDTEYAALLDGQTSGQIMGADENGYPVLSAPEPPSLDQVRAAADAAMMGWIDGFLAQFTAGVPPAELASWPVKAERARQHIAGDPQPMIAAEAALTGEDAMALAQKIVTKADAYEAIIARVTGLRRATEAAIAEAKTAKAVAAALEVAKDKATQMAAQMGLPVT